MSEVLRIQPVGASATLLTVEPGTATAWREHLLELAAAAVLPPPDDVVPGHRTVLVDGVAPADVTTALEGRTLPASDEASRADRVVEIPTAYDGPDLGDVARLWGVDETEVVARHTRTEFVVDFCGFAPGFAYLAGLDVETPRRATPRTKVPAGAVGLAGRYCGIYPTSSPGGWQLIGRTSTALFDVAADPPALLPPGTRVRFVAADEPTPTSVSTSGRTTRPTDAQASRPAQADRASGPTLTVVRAGALTTVQDRGRPGWAHLGVPRSGALDRPAARLANRLVGNAESAALLETTLNGVTVRLDHATDVAVTGAPAPVRVDGRPAGWGVSIAVPAGAVVDVGSTRSGVRSYLAVAGGVTTDPVLGSRCTDTLSCLGPPPLSNGQTLPIGAPADPPGSGSLTAPRPPGEVVLRLRLGPDDGWFTTGGLRTATESTYAVSPSSNRVGVRLRGPAIAWVEDREMDSAGMVLGAVQVPPDGEPLVFLADHPTTGGYPVLGVVDDDDLSTLAQARPGSPVRFQVRKD